jgi:hypothetical protein
VNIALTSGTLTSQELNNPEIRLTNGDARISTLNNGAVNITYGSLDLGTADNIKARVVYGGMNVDKLKTSGDLAAVYGNGIKVIEVDRNCKTLNVKAMYTKVNLGVKDNYDFDVTTTLGSFDYDKNAVRVISTTPEENTRHYSATRTFKGQVNKGNSDRAITIKSTYTQVKFD